MADKDRIGLLITQLGSHRFHERDRAGKALEDLGAPALAALRKAADGEDAETRRRAGRLVERIERRLEMAALLAPTRVRLVCNDMLVTDAIAELSRKSKVDLQIDPASRDKLARRKVTLDTGKVTFWEALDRLCQKANLVETTQQLGGYSPYQYERFQRVIPANVLPANRLPIRQPPLRNRQGRAQPRPQQRAVNRNFQVQVRNAAAPIQIQLPANARPIQVLPAMPVNARVISAYEIYNGVQDNGQITLADGKPEVLPTCYAGAVRIRLRTNAAQSARASDALSFQLEVSVEPRLRNWSLAGQPRIDVAADDHGQNLTLAMDASPAPDYGMDGRLALRVYMIPSAVQNSYRQSVSVRLKAGDKPAQVLKQLKGNLAADMVTPPEALLAMDNILKAAGKTVKGKRGGWLKVLEVKKDDNGNYQVRYQLEPPDGVSDPMNPFRGMGGMGGLAFRRVVRWNAINGNMVGGMGFGNPANLSLMDARGNAYAVVGMSSRNDNGAIENTLTFQAPKDVGAPARLVYTGQRKVSVEVPFGLQDVKLR
jgi:hypothetical protein